jgi:hypothetical protein
VNLILVYLVTGIVVGALAQRWKRRSGVLWAILTFPAFFFWYSVAIRVPRDGSDEMLNDSTNAVFAALFAAGTMLIIVATLRRGRLVIAVDNPGANPDSAGDTMPCPRCAEPIKKAAKICRFCKYDLTSEAQQTLGSQSDFQDKVSGTIDVHLTDPGMLAFKARCRVLIDGQDVGRIQIGNAASFPVPAGQHELGVAMDVGPITRRSRPLRVLVADGETVRVIGNYSRQWGKYAMSLSR